MTVRTKVLLSYLLMLLIPVLIAVGAGRTPLVEFSDLVVLLLVAALVVGNGLAATLIYRNTVRPLRRLEAAAGRISTGDLETPLDHGEDQRDEIGRLNRAFEHMRVSLCESLAQQRDDEESLRELIAGISHDLRTPVTAIKGYVEGIRDGLASTPEKRDRYLATIAEKASVINRLIEELFLLATLELNEVPFQWRRVDLTTFLEDSVEELRLRYESHQVSVALECEARPVVVSADSTRLRRVLENVVENSVRHRDGDRLVVAICVKREEDWAQITVKDDGPGIPADVLPHVFERFFKADRSPGSEGSGLGLAIAKSLVEAHGGRIDAECPEQGGTRVLITLPLDEEDLDEPVDEPVEEPADEPESDGRL